MIYKYWKKTNIYKSIIPSQNRKRPRFTICYVYVNQGPKVKTGLWCAGVLQVTRLTYSRSLKF